MPCRRPWPAQLEFPVQAAASHPSFVSDTTFSSPANLTTIQYVNGSTTLIYSSAFESRPRVHMRMLHETLDAGGSFWHGRAVRAFVSGWQEMLGAASSVAGISAA